MAQDFKHRSNNALGACLISAIFAVKVAVYQSVTPSKATPYIFGLLAAAAGVSLVQYFRLKRKAREQSAAQATVDSRGGSNAI